MQNLRLLRKSSLFVLALAGVLVLAGCSALSSDSPPASSSGEPLTNTLSVNGVGEASAAPDIAFVDLGILVVGREVVPAVERSNRTANAIIEAVGGAGVDDSDIQTSNFNVWSEERYDPFSSEDQEIDPQVIYRVENGVRVVVRDVTQLGTVIQAGLDAGANQVRGVNFSIDDSDALEEEARAQAIADARRRAEDLAFKMGVTLGDPIIISEGTGGPGPGSFDSFRGLGGGGGGPPISAGELSFQVQVFVTYEIQ